MPFFTQKIARPVFTRRSLLAGIGGVTILSTHPLMATAGTTGKSKLVIVILRGAMDGLAAVSRPDDERLRSYRPDLIPEDALPLSDGFALHPSLTGLGDMYKGGEAAIIHAISGPYRERSHFLAQDLLESGSEVNVTTDGWLNRALQTAPAPLTAVSIGTVTPLILRGSATASTWSPPALPEVDEDTIGRLQNLYEADPLLGPAFTEALALDEIADGMKMSGKRRTQDKTVLTATGRLLTAEAGPDIAVVSLSNWDTHANQAGALSRRLESLDEGISALKKSMGTAWENTAVAVVTEFGRTVRQNGTRGSDHGTGGAAFVLGGAIKGGQILGDWPGLAGKALYENRDLYPANDLRSLFKALLAKQFAFGNKEMSTNIFPDSVGTPTFTLT